LSKVVANNSIQCKSLEQELIIKLLKIITHLVIIIIILKEWSIEVIALLIEHISLGREILLFCIKHSIISPFLLDTKSETVNEYILIALIYIN
jgi:hypothetical protein